MGEEVVSLQDAIRQRDCAWDELRKIRAFIHADANESTYDEVVRMLSPGAGRARLSEEIPDHPRTSTDEDVVRVYEGWWKPLFLEDPDLAHVPETERMSCVRSIPMFIRRELYDYSILLEHVPKVYMEVTGGRVSKPNTVAASVIGEYEDHVSRLCREAADDVDGDFDDYTEVEWLSATSLLEDVILMIPPRFSNPAVMSSFSVLSSVCEAVDKERKEERARIGITESHAAPQPPPTAGRSDVLDALLLDYNERAEMGLKKYGTRLKTFNGRDALVDALQEAMDLSLYLKQRLMEEAAKERKN